MVKKILVLMLLIYKATTVAFATELVAGASANIASESAVPSSERTSYQSIMIEENRKRKAILTMLEQRNSPLASSVDTFIAMCEKYKFDCYLLPSIAGLESSFGHYTHPGSYNPFGWGGGYIMFNTWDEAIEAVGTGLGERYIARGATTVEAIGSIYAESPTWAQRVRGFMGQFENIEEKSQTSLSSFELQL